jgi:acetyl esterase/lipase
MTTRHLVDPKIAVLLDALPALSLTSESLPQTRAMFKEMFAQMSAMQPEFPDISISERHIPGPQGAPDVRVLVYLPKNVMTSTPALLWIHGGGYVIGSADQADLDVKNIVSSLGCAAVSVDYRLAPEIPHPGPVEDCYAALK